MARNNNNQGNNPIWADNSDRTFSTMASFMTSTPDAQANDSEEADNRAHQTREILDKISGEVTRLGRVITQKLTGRNNS